MTDTKFEKEAYSRLLYNRVIIKKLSELVDKYPQLRFGQLLLDSGVITIGNKGNVKDPFYEESKTTWQRMIDNNLCFNKDNK